MSAKAEKFGASSKFSSYAAVAYAALRGTGKRTRRENRVWYVQYRDAVANKQPWSRYSGDPVEALRSGEIAFAIRSAEVPNRTVAPTDR
jgi:hypothetical protein